MQKQQRCFRLRHNTLLCALALGALSAHAAQRVDLEQAAKSQGLLSPAATAHSVTGLHAEELKPLRRQHYAASGVEVTRYQQYWQGVPVWGEAVVESRKQQGAPQFSGAMLRDLSQDIGQAKPALSAQAAIALAKQRAAISASSNEQAKLYVRLDAQQRAQLFYLVSILTHQHGKASRPTMMVDAMSGEIFQQWEGLAHKDAQGPGGNGKTGKYEYGVTYGALQVSDDCSMSNADVKTLHMRNGSSDTPAPYQFNCPRSEADAVNGAFSPLNDAHFFGSVIQNMYKAWVGVTAVNPPLVMKVHYGNNYGGAYWDGGAMVFGDGDASIYPLTVLDVAAHEISHGFTEHNSGLVYSGMSGSINEAFSDMAGEAAEYYLRGKNDFLVGAEVLKADGAIRYMAEPGKDGKSLDHQSKFSSTTDVHYGSGIFNKAFYLLATTPGWNTKMAFQVMADANRLHWTQTSTFNAAACGVEKAAQARGWQVAAVKAAFQAVGVSCATQTQTVTLINGQSVNSGSLASAASRLYSLSVPAGKSSLTFKLSGGTGNGNLYLQRGSAPSVTSYLRKSDGSTNTESITISRPAGGTWYLLLSAKQAVNNATLVGSYK
ncbi:M4 family metallopeptidase [Massilia sp. W12]|uniref:M4 family metallopeptidase n=1 Tax=Massilia sp. W12 TaxID=3126507 RepID=UPI0030CEDC1B